MREFLHLTQEDLAKRLRVSATTVARWESSHPPRGKTLERLYRFAQRSGPAVAADMFLRQITQEKSAEYRRYRRAQILDAGNLNDAQKCVRELWEAVREDINPNFEKAMYARLMELADLLLVGGRKELLGEDE